MLALLLLVAFAVGWLTRARLEPWLLGSLERAVREQLGGRVEFGSFDLSLPRLELRFEDARLELPASSGIALSGAVPRGRVRLAWSSLIGLVSGRVHLAELRLDRPDVSIGAWRREGGAGGGPPLDLRIDRLRIDAGRFAYRDVEVPLELQARDIELRAGWENAHRALTGRLSAIGALDRPPLVRPIPLRVESAFRLSRHDVELQELALSGEGLELRGQTNVRFSPDLEVAGRGELQLDLGKLGADVDPELPAFSGLLSGPVAWEYGGGPLRLRGKLEVDEPRFGRFAADRASAGVRYSQGRLELVNLLARAFDGVVQGSLEIDWKQEPTFRAELNARDLDSESVLAWIDLPLALAGRIELDGKLAGAADRRESWNGSGRFTVLPDTPTEGSLPIDGSGEFRVAQGRLRLEADRVELAAARLDVKLDVGLEADDRRGAVDLDGATANARATQKGAERLLLGLGIEIPETLRQPLSGHGSVHARIGVGQPELELGLQLELGSVGKETYDTADVHLLLEGDRLTVDRLDLREGPRRLAGQAELSLDPLSVNALSAEMEALEAGWLLELAGFGREVEGRVEGRIRVRQDDAGRSGSGILRLTEGRWRDEVLDRVLAEITIEPERVRFDHLAVDAPGAELVGNGVWNEDRLELVIDAGSLTLERLAALQERDLAIGGEVRLSGRVRLGKDLVDGRIRLASEDVQVYGRSLGGVEGLVLLDPRGLDARLGGPPQTRWSLSSRIGWEAPHPFELALEMQDTSIRVEEADTQSLVTGEHRLAGELADPDGWTGEGIVRELEVKRGLKRLNLDAPVRWSFADRRWSAESLRFVGPDSRIDGKLAYDLGQDRLELEAEGFLDLGVLAAAVPDIRASGRVDVSVRATGPLSRPDVVGSLRADSTRFRLLGFPQTLDQLRFHVTLDRQEATLHELRARFGNGEITAEGTARLEGLGLDRYEILADAANVRVVYPEGFRGVYEGRLALRGDDESATLGGRLVMLRGIYEKEFDLLGSGRTYSASPTTELPGNVFLDLVLQADGNLWVRNELAHIESSFDLHLGGSLQRPEVTGRLWMFQGGKIEFRDVAYQVRSGSLDFVERDRLNPYLTLRAETDVKEYTVFLRVEGTLDRFEYELTSEPTLSTQDIIALLTTGNTLEEITGGPEGGAPFTGDVAANYFAGALTSPFEKQLQKLLGLERVRINPLLIEGEADPTTRLTLGEEVAEDVMLIFSTDIGKSERQLYQVDWQATRRIRLSAQRDTEGGVGGDLRYTNRFWWRRRAGTAERTERSRSEAVGLADPQSRIASIMIRGGASEELPELRRRVGLAVGDPFSRSTMFAGVAAIKRFYVAVDRIGTRVNADANTVGEETHVIFDVTPGPPTEVRLLGVEKKERRRLRPVLEELWVESAFGEDLYLDSVEQIRRDFQERGYYAVDVTYAATQSEGKHRLDFIVDRGDPVRVEGVILSGVRDVSEELLRSQMLTRPASTFSRRLLVPSVLEQDVRTIVTACREQGFLRATLQEPAIYLATDSATAEIELIVDEGPRFTVGEVRFPGGTPFEPETMAEWSGLEPGETFSPTGLLQAESRLLAAIDAQGYPDARVRSSLAVGAAEVDVAFTVEAGDPQRLGDVQIEGNALTREKVILRELELEPGQPVSREKILQSQHQLYQLGIFRNVRLALGPVEGEDPTLRRLHVRVDEAAPLSTTVGAGYDSEAKAGVSFSLSHANVGGYDRTLSIQSKYSGLEKRIQLVGTEPSLFDRELAALAQIGWEEQEETGYTVERRTAAVRLDRQLEPRWGAFLRYGFEQVDLSDITISPEELEEEKLVDGRLGNLGAAVVRDTRDNPILPTRGTYFTTGAALFAKPLISEFTFLKSTITGSWIRPFREKSTSASSVRLGFAWPFGSTVAVPISEAFFAGGDSTIRGFPRDEVGPASGGEALFIINQEVRFPIWRDLRGVAFYDGGNVYQRANDFDPTDIRHVLGAGLRLETPIGPIRLEYGRKLDREPGESLGELFLSIGSAF